MKKSILFLLLLISVTSYGQDSTFIDPKGQPWCTYDPSTNFVSNITKALPLPPYPLDCQITCGSIRVTFKDVYNGTGTGFDDPILGATRRNCVCDAMNYIQSVIVFPPSITPANPVDILFNLSLNDPFDPRLGFASPVFPSAFFSSTPGYYSGHVYDFITSGVNPAAPFEEHGQITMNFYHNFSYCTPAIGDCQYDFESVTIHEFVHLLGIGSLVQENTTTSFLESAWAPNVFTEWDRVYLFYRDGAGVFNKLVDIGLYSGTGGINPALPLSMFSFATSNRVWVTNDVLTTRMNQPVNSQSPYSPGTSLSHLAQDYLNRCSFSPSYEPNYLMSGFLSFAKFKTSITKEELRILEGMGYIINTSTVTNYTNLPPSLNGNVVIPSTAGYPETAIPSGNPNLFITTTNCNTVTVDLNSNTITDGFTTHTLDFYDPEGDPMTVFNGQLFNLRGCGNGGNNNNQLTINASNNIITFNPRTNFVGRAQFAFHLYDGKDRGAYVVISVDVNPDACFNNGIEHTINGTFEEGMLIKNLSNETATITSDGIDVAGHYIYNRFCDGQEYVGFGWQDQSVRESFKACLYGGPVTSFPAPGTASVPIGDVGDRFTNFASIEAFHVRMAPELLNCYNYILEMDITFSNSVIIGTTVPLQIALRNAVGGTDLFSATIPVTHTGAGVWNHVTLPVFYSSTLPANYFHIDPVGAIFCHVDNLSIHDDLSAPIGFPTIVVSPPTANICPGASVVLTSSGAATYSWSPSIGLSVTTGSVVTANPTISTTYTVTGTDVGGCVGTGSVTVNVNPTPVITVSPASSTICIGGSTTLTASGASTYSWSPSTGLSATTGAIVTANPSSTTTYTVIGTDAFGCIGSQTVTVTVDPSPTVTISSVPSIPAICGTGSVTLNATGASTYSWSPSTGLSATTGATVTATPSSTTLYTVTGTTGAGCVGTASVTVYFVPSFSISASASEVAVCEGTPVILTVTGTPPLSTILWSIGGSTASVGDIPSVTTTYSVLVTPAGGGGGCSQIASVIVIVKNDCCTGVFEIDPSATTPPPPIGLGGASALALIPSGIMPGGPFATVAINDNFIIDENFLINNKTVLMAANVKIIVKAPYTLTINKTKMYTCGPKMWEGIVIEKGAKLVLTKSRIEDAEIAVLADNNLYTGVADFYIEQTVFNRNYIGIKVIHYFSSTGVLHPGKIINCKFDSDGLTSIASTSPLLDIPHSTQTAEYGIELLETHGIEIGSAALVTDENKFRYLRTGIRARASEYFAYNNDFQNNFTTPTCIFPSVCSPVGWAIWNTETRATIGGYLPYQKNNFKNISNGILHEVGSFLEVYKNTFTNITTLSVPLKSVAILTRTWSAGNMFINDNDFKDLEIGIMHQNISKTNITTKSNLLKNFTDYGIYGIQNQDGVYTVANNTFNQSVSSPYTGNVAVNFSNVVIPLSACPNLTITDNIIAKVNKGVQIVHYNNPKILNNTIDFPSSTTPALLYGIRSQNNDKEVIKGNGITKFGGVPSSTFENLFYGISVETNLTNATVAENSVTKTGSGIRFYFCGSANSLVSCNIMTHNHSGLTIDLSNIGTQGSSITITPPFGIANDNQWSAIPGTMPLAASVRGLGAYTSSDFYTRGSGYPWCPSLGNVTPAGTINTTLTSGPTFLVSSAPTTCPNICYVPPCTHLSMAKIARNESPFNLSTGNDKFTLQEGLLRAILADTTLNDTTDADINDLILFRDTTLLNTELGKIAMVADTFAKGDTLYAKALNLTIVPDKCAELYHRTVNEIFFNSWAIGKFYQTPIDSIILDSIARQNPSICGTAIYNARVMIGIDINDFSSPPKSLIEPETTFTKDRVGILYPNPAGTSCFYEVELAEEESGLIIIYDINGKIIQSGKLNAGYNKLEMDLSTFDNGVYPYKIFVNSELLDTKKLVITK